MTAARRNRKLWFGPGLTGVALAAALVAAVAPLVDAATTERIVVDRHTGLAIHGFDPVAYFTDARATVGRAEMELSYAGVVWRFRNPGNRTAFAERPDVYMPRFGGYDPTALARGVAVPGHPQFWLIRDDRLYLFHSQEARDAFTADPRPAIAAAQANWPEVLRSLAP
jgi:YHS domain-containing protein